MNKAIIVILAIAISTALVAQENHPVEQKKQPQCPILERLAQQEERLEKLEKKSQQEKEALEKKIAEMESSLNEIKNSHPSSRNLFVNSTFTELDSAGLPTGWFCYGSGITMHSVHSYTKGFIGPYRNEKPENTVNDPELATENSPYWYGIYNCGPRISRWEWGGLNFRLLHLKISGNSDMVGIFQNSPHAILIGNERGRYHMRCYVKVIQGELGFSQDVTCTTLIVNKEICDQSPQGWYLVDGNILSCNTNANLIGFGRPFPIKGDLECYIALPYVYLENALWVNDK